MDTRDDDPGLWLEYGGLCVVDCGRLLEVDSLDPDDFIDWFAQQAMVLLEEEQRSVRVRTELGRVPPGVPWGELDAVSGEVFVGSTEMLVDPLDPADPGEGVMMRVPPGAYRVGIETVGEGDYLVYLEASDELLGTAEGNLTDWVAPDLVRAPASRSLRSAPLLGQLSTTAERLGAWLGEAGTLLRLARDANPPVRLMGADVGPTLSSQLPEDIQDLLERRRWQFAHGEEEGEVCFVHSGNRRRVLRVVLRDEAVVDASLASPLPTSQGDLDEVRDLVRAAYAADPGPGLSVRAVPLASAQPSGPVEPQLEWSSDKLTIRLARPELPRPVLRVTFFDGPLPVEQSEVRPLYLREGAWLYEVWLVGPREGLTVAHAQLA